MSKEKFVFNQDTLQYEEVKTTGKEKAGKVFGFLSSVLFASVLLFVFAWFFLPSPKEQALKRELAQMEHHYSNLNSDVQKISEELGSLHEKDSEIHRMIFQMDQIDDNVWEGGVGGHDKYPNVVTYPSESGSLVKSTLQLVDKIKRKLSTQKASLDTIQHKAFEWEEKLASVPSIKPIRETELKRNIRYLSGYGYRIHPIHKIKKFHYGIDFTAPRGTDVQSTGNGVVKKVERRKSGYGNSVLIDHGYHYETLYAHMDKVIVKKGQRVIKGQKLGLVGSTGTSTAPHLHYEVRLRGKAVDPIHYCIDGLSPDEYSILVNKAGQENQSLD